MKKKVLILQVLLGLSVALFPIQPAWGLHTRTFGNIEESTSKLQPSSTNTEKMGIACYEVTLAQLERPLIDCPFTLQLNGLTDDGGHVHAPPHPMVDPNKVTLQFDGLDLDASPFGIESSTEDKVVVVRYPLSEVAGRVQFEVIIDSPEGFVCASGCFTETSHKFIHNVDVGMSGLTNMTSANENHWRFGGGLPGHPNPFYLQATASGPIDLVAINYATMACEKREQEFGIQFESKFECQQAIGGEEIPRLFSASLKKGGLFDLDQNWEAPYQFHRRGLNVEIEPEVDLCTQSSDIDFPCTDEVPGRKPVLVNTLNMIMGQNGWFPANDPSFNLCPACLGFYFAEGTR